jgi:CheY-like chemotaxis protein
MVQTILIVDDDPDVRNIFGTALQDRGYRVLIGVNGAEAVHLAGRNEPDLILLDLRMPVMDAWEAIRYLRSIRRTAGKGIWAISAYLEEGDARKDGFSRFDRVFSKPLDPRDLVTAVDEYFGGPGPLFQPPALPAPE